MPCRRQRRLVLARPDRGGMWTVDFYDSNGEWEGSTIGLTRKEATALIATNRAPPPVANATAQP